MPSTRRQKTKARRSREAGLMWDIENMDVMLVSPHYSNLDEEIEVEFETRNRETRERSSQENDIRSDNRSNRHWQPSTTENLERRFEKNTNEMNARLSNARTRRTNVHDE